MRGRKLKAGGSGAWLLMLALVFAPAASAAPRKPSATAPAAAVSLTRDSAGIPHITARNFTALGYGDGYAFSQDNFCTLAEGFVTVNGERSRYFGPTGLSINYSAQASDTNLNSDFFWQYIKASHLIDRLVSQPPPIGPLPQIKQVYAGFVRGYNAYLRSGRLRDPRCKGQPWVRPITIMDMWLRGEQIATENASAQFITGLANAVPPGAAAPATARSAFPSSSGSPGGLSPAGLAALDQSLGGGDSSTSGSNGIGLGALDTRSGNGMVLANPHFPWRGTERFWMAQLTVPGQYDVLGGTLEGFPLVGIGFNRHIAWTHTVSTSRRFVIYQLKLVPGDPTSYYVDGKPEKMTPVTVQVPMSGGGTASHTFYATRWGLVTTVTAAGYGWTNDTAYALDDTVATDSARVANQFLRMGQATSVQGLLAVESKFLAIPTFNTVAADDHGNALYTDVGNTPNVSQAKIGACLPSGVPQFVFASARVVTLDGSRSACGPDNDPGTPVPGIFNATHMPHLIRRDYVENSNDSYWLANPSSPLTGFSPIIGLTDTAQGLRTRLGDQMIAQRMAGSDGLGAPKFTIGTLQGMWENDRSYEAELVLPALVGACQANPHVTATNGQAVDLTAACSALAGYDKTGSLDAHGGWLFYEWARRAPSAGFYADAFDPAHPLTTPSQLNTSNPAILRVLADAVQELQIHSVPLDATYGQVQHATRGSSRIPIHGCNTGCFNAIQASRDVPTDPPVQAGPYGEVFTGSSLVMTTELTRRGPVSQGILTYSQATDPTSPWYANLTRLYSQKRWVNLRYTPAALRRDRGARTVVLRVR